MLDCTNCSWRHPETCQACRQEQAAEEAQATDEVERLRRLAEKIVGRKAWAFANAAELTAALNGLDRETSEGYRVDAAEWTRPKYSHQN